MPSSEVSIENALSALRLAIKHELRAERLRDSLTQLGNGEALNEWLQEQIDSQSPFWIAFFEVDRFKSVNDQFGYPNANQLLKKIAEHLNGNAKDYFISEINAFRAHGDEFFLAGHINDSSITPEDLHHALDQTRASISAIRLPIRKNGLQSAMHCTVSVGWMLSEDSLAAEPNTGLTPQGVIDKLQQAVARAKQDRNCVVRFDPSHSDAPTADGRQDCKSCKAKFSITIPQSRLQHGELSCPNCGAQLERPFSLIPQS